jgi:hypothetical protein
MFTHELTLNCVMWCAAGAHISVGIPGIQSQLTGLGTVSNRPVPYRHITLQHQRRVVERIAVHAVVYGAVQQSSKAEYNSTLQYSTLRCRGVQCSG